MSAIELLQAVFQVTWVVLAAIAIARAIRKPTRTNADIALFFGALAIALVESRLLAIVDAPFEAEIAAAGTILAIASPYLLLRVVGDFAQVPLAVEASALAGLALSVALLLGYRTAPLPIAAVLFVLGYFAAVTIYAAYRVIGLARSATGVTGSRMQAIALASYLLGIAALVAGVGAVAPPLAAVASGLSQALAVACAVSFFVGFAPPAALKRYWQTPEFRGFLGRASTLPRTRMDEIVGDLEQVAGRALGARATIGLWDEEKGVLRFHEPRGALPTEVGPSGFVAWRVFSSQQATYVPDAARAHPRNAEAYRKAEIGPLLVAPITAGERRLGVLEIFASRQPIFAEDDLSFAQLMAQQAAVLLESRSLIDDAARVRAQEETARLKEDFVSAAAHDLKTPLTTIVAQAQLLEMRAEREGRTGELAGLRRLVRETGQLARLVEELLDASRLDRGAFELDLQDVDLADVIRDVAHRERVGGERIEVDAPQAVNTRVDPQRVTQLAENLIDNALKYSPQQSRVSVRVWDDGDAVRISVADSGIGVPAEDLPHLFERFRRGSNVDHRRYGGIGLGLYICRGIAEQHGGRIWVETQAGRGSVFNVAFPRRQEPAQLPAPAQIPASTAG